jgi:hypothetical protein
MHHWPCMFIHIYKATHSHCAQVSCAPLRYTVSKYVSNKNYRLQAVVPNCRYYSTISQFPQFLLKATTKTLASITGLRRDVNQRYPEHDAEVRPTEPQRSPLGLLNVPRNKTTSQTDWQAQLHCSYKLRREAPYWSRSKFGSPQKICISQRYSFAARILPLNFNGTFDSSLMYHQVGLV